MTRSDMNRRGFLARGLALGCTAAASPLMTPVSFAAAPWDNRLVVIILRGGMDGIDAVQPYGDADFVRLRGMPRVDQTGGPKDLDGFYALHPALSPLYPLWRRGELSVVQAVSTPYRDKRSHFDGQDLLEAGTAMGAPLRDGWLNRMLQAMPGLEMDTAYAIGRDEMLLTRGAAPVREWTPEADMALSPQALRLAEMLMSEDPAFAAAFADARALADLDGDPVEVEATAEEMQASTMAEMQSAQKGAPHVRVARFAAERLREEARIAAFSLNGWDTHQMQGRTLSNALKRLARSIEELRKTTGPEVWSKTAVLVMTEFGRTVRLNGNKGTDHGTAGAMLLAGGALRGGRVHGDWPGLSEAALYDRRDLMPTRDVRAHAAWVMRGLFGLDRAVLEGAVFPGLDMGADPRLLA